MVVTLALETDEARAAAAAATEGDGLAAPRAAVDGRYARVGTIARIESTGELPDGVRSPGGARALPAPSSASASPAPAPACGSRSSRVDDPEPHRPRPRARDGVPRRRRGDRRARGARRLAEVLAGVDDPARSPTPRAGGPTSRVERKVELLETVDVEARLELARRWAREALADLELTEKIRTEVTDGIDKQQREFLLRRQMDAIRKELGEGDDDVVAEYRTRLAERELPDSVREAVDKRARPARAHGRAEPRAGVDPHLARHVLDAAVGHALRRRPRRSATRARCSTPTTTASTT